MMHQQHGSKSDLEIYSHIDEEYYYQDLFKFDFNSISGPSVDYSRNFEQHI